MKNQKIMKITVVVGLIAVILLGVTFALTSITTAGTKRQVITTGELDLILDEGDAINITNAMPVYDEVGMIGDAFNFRLINKTPVSLAYTLKLVKVSTSNELSPEIVRYGLTKGGETTIDFLSTITDDIVDSGTISGNQTIKYSLRLWIDINVEDETLISDKTLSYRVDAEASDDTTEKWSANFGIDDSKANSPVLTSGMIPVVYNEDTREWVKASTEQQKYYNYEKQIWANAVTVIPENREFYMKAKSGTPILMDDINTMWVWIPRYEYMYTNLGDKYAGGSATQPGEIVIHFISIDQIITSDSNIYKIPEGFQFGTDQLSGFWMAKFESAGTISEACTSENCTTANLLIKPNINSVTNQILSSFFYASRSMQNTTNASKYGFDVIGDGTMDVHMARNTEWGIVAMLSQSKYGKYGNPVYEGTNKEVYQNGRTMTGYSNAVPAAISTADQVPYDTPDTGYGASTAGTIYGVYDMSGGAAEAVMANYYKTAASSGFTSFPEAKYYDYYAESTISKGYKAGDATYETSGWYADSSFTLFSNYSWVNRGGITGYTTASGVFSASNYPGNEKDYSSHYYGMRITIKP